MTETDQARRPDEAPLFAQLVVMFATSVLQQLGKLVNPQTGRAEEPDLDAAQATIEILEMLEQKTRGNLDAEEAKILKDALASLKLTFWEAAQAAPPPPPAAGATPATPAQPAPGEAPGAPAGDRKAEPKFHKKYS